MGNERQDCLEFLGIPYAKAKRFSYGELVEGWEGELNATEFGPACPQYREFFPHLDVPERKFYHREFRDGLSFTYSEENGLNLNIYTPKEPGKYPVVIFIHGGGFNSMANCESYLDGASYAKRGIILVTINYRVGVFGYFSHEDIQKENGRDGNFGLDDQLLAVKWVKKNIASFGGDPENITLMGQSAGAMSIQLLCLSEKAQGLFQRAIMMSGAGCLPSFAQYKRPEKTREYWKEVMKIAGVENLQAFKELSVKEVLQAVETIKTQRKDNQSNTMPIVDGYLVKDDVAKIIKHPMKIDYLVGYTSCDMFTWVWGRMASKYAKKNGAYLYLFDIDAPGDDNKAFHSCDLRYAFGTLDKSWRPYDIEDHQVSELIIDYFASFIKTGDPNGKGRTPWKKGKTPLWFTKEGAEQRRAPTMRLLKNTLRGDPK